MYSSNACAGVIIIIIIVVVVIVVVVVIDGQMRTSRTTILCFSSIVETKRPFLSGVHTVLSALIFLRLAPSRIDYLRRACSSPYLLLVPSFAFPRRSFSFTFFFSMTGWCSYWSIHVFVFLQAIDKGLTISQANEDTFSFFLTNELRAAGRTVFEGSLLCLA